MEVMPRTEFVIIQNESQLFVELENGTFHVVPQDMYINIRMAQCSLMFIGVAILALIIFNEGYLRIRKWEIKELISSQVVVSRGWILSVWMESYAATYILFSYALFIVSVVISASNLLQLVLLSREDTEMKYYIYFSTWELLLMAAVMAVYVMFIFLYFPALLLQYFCRQPCFLVLAISFNITSAYCMILCIGYVLCAPAYHTSPEVGSSKATIISNLEAWYADRFLMMTLAPVCSILSLFVSFLIMLHVHLKTEYFKDEKKNEQFVILVDKEGDIMKVVNHVGGREGSRTMLKQMMHMYIHYVTELSNEIYNIK